MGYTPLHWAVWFSDDTASVEALLDAGADATAQDIDGNTPWDYAKYRGELQGSDAYQRLSEAQGLAADLESPAPCAEWNTREFFESATSAEVSDCLTAGAYAGASDKDVGTLLHLAARYNDNPAVITALVDAGADVGARNRYDNTPLHLAAESSNNPAIITALIDAGADLGALKALQGWTPLHGAARYNDNPAVITTLVDAGAEVDAQGRRWRHPPSRCSRVQRQRRRHHGSDRRGGGSGCPGGQVRRGPTACCGLGQ